VMCAMRQGRCGNKERAARKERRASQKTKKKKKTETSAQRNLSRLGHSTVVPVVVHQSLFALMRTLHEKLQLIFHREQEQQGQEGG